MKNTNQNIPIAILFIYLAVNLYVAALNWDIFSTVLNLDFGFGNVAMPPFLFLFLFGLLLILALWFFEYRKDMRNYIQFLEEEAKVIRLEKDVEIESLKAGTIQQKLDSTIKEKPIASTNQLKPVRDTASAG